VALTGVGAAGATGTITHGGAVVGLTGVNVLGEEGSVIASFPRALTGVNSTGQVGSVIAVYWKPIDDTSDPLRGKISTTRRLPVGRAL
jgi:hypothetical protein